MKPTATQVMHHVGQVDEEMEMGIAKDAMAHIMSVLTDLYSDQILAVIREYSTNALDSNIEAGNPAPIEVTLPTTTSPQFIVKDQGLGLNVDDLRNIYSMYGSSTKRDSDAVTGMLGLGCKSGLTYSLQFTVDAVKNGVRSIALVTKNAEGVGTIKILDTAGTDDPNGVTVTVPVKSHDVNAFRMKALNFYRFWNPDTVVLAGIEGGIEFERNVDDLEHIWIDEDIRVDKTAGQSYVVMGNVPYPFNWPNLDFQHSVIAWVPMGSVNFTPSREALMTTSLTEDTLSAVREYVLDRFPKVLNQRLVSASSNWERIKVWNSWRLKAGHHGIAGYVNSFGGGTLRLPQQRNAFTFDVFEARASKTEDYFSHKDLQDERRAVVIDYPHRSVITAARARLKQLAQENSLARAVVVLPAGMTVDALEGRPNLYTWDEVLDATDAPEKEKRTKGETLYTFVFAGVQGVQAGTFPDDGVPTVYIPLNEVPLTAKTSRYSWRQPSGLYCVAEYSKRHPEARFVSIGVNQVEKFCRLHPHAEKYSDYIDRQQQEALDALTEQDKMACHLNGIAEFLGGDLKAANVSLSDPLLRQLAGLAGHTSPAIERCKKLSVAIPAPKSKLAEDLVQRYPLLSQIYQHHYGAGMKGSARDDLILYLEAKFGVSNDPDDES